MDDRFFNGAFDEGAVMERRRTHHEILGAQDSGVNVALHFAAVMIGHRT